MRVRYFHADERTSPLSTVNQALPEIAADDELSGRAGNCTADLAWLEIDSKHLSQARQTSLGQSLSFRDHSHSPIGAFLAAGKA